MLIRFKHTVSDQHSLLLRPRILEVNGTYENCLTKAPSPPFSKSTLNMKKFPSLVTTITCGPLLLSATTVLMGPDDGPVEDLGILTQAKSRDGSQISATALGK